MKCCRIVIADDHPVLQEGIKLLIETNENYKVIACSYNGLRLLEILKKAPADVAIIDLLMPGIQGLELLREIKRLYPEMRTIVLSGFLNGSNVDKAISAGADGIVSKAGLGKEILKAIETVWNGGRYIPPELAGIEILGHDKKVIDILTHRERQIISLISEGFTNKKIGEILSISPRTVEKHRDHILDKLKLNNTAELIRFAIINGLSHPTRPISIPYPS